MGFDPGADKESGCPEGAVEVYTIDTVKRSICFQGGPLREFVLGLKPQAESFNPFGMNAKDP
jgi:hypothetical protein